MEVFNEVYKLLKDCIKGESSENNRLLIASEVYLIYIGLRSGAIIMWENLEENKKLYLHLANYINTLNIRIYPYRKKENVFILFKSTKENEMLFRQIDEYPDTNKNSINIKTGTMLGYVYPTPLRTIKNIGKFSGEVNINNIGIFRQIAPQVVPENALPQLESYLKIISSELNTLYERVGIENRAHIIIQKFPNRGGSRKQKRKTCMTRKI